MKNARGIVSSFVLGVFLGAIIFVVISTGEQKATAVCYKERKVQRPISHVPATLICQSQEEALLPFFDSVIYVFTEDEERELFQILEKTYMPELKNVEQHTCDEVRASSFLVRSKVPSYSAFFEFDEDGRLMFEKLGHDGEVRLKKLMESVLLKIEQRKNLPRHAALFLCANTEPDRIPFVCEKLCCEPISQCFFIVEFDLLNRPSRVIKMRNDGERRSREWEKHYTYYRDTAHLRLFACHDLSEREFKYYSPTGELLLDAKGDEARKLIKSNFMCDDFHTGGNG